MKAKYVMLVLILSSLLLTTFYFYPIIAHLNSVLFVNNGDGLKNYFTYLFYINQNTGVHFTGMNYPFGENVVFTDNTPLLAWTIKAVGSYIPAVGSYALGIMHTSLLLSLTIGSVYVFKILKRFGVANWWAIPSALFIIYFSPQLFKLQGHFGMAYLCYLPMQIFWLMRYHQSGKWKFLAYTALLTTLFTFLHVYQLAFTLVLGCSYVVSHFIIYRKAPLKSRLGKMIPVLLFMLISCIVFVLYLKLTDPVSDRTTYPYGVFGSGTTGADIFTSAITPLGLIFQFLFGGANGPGEGYTYIGLISILVCLFLIYRIIRSISLNVIKHTKVATHPLRDFRIWLLIALFELLFSMGVPFVWHLQFLADYFPPLRQFRAMGRFSWSFYYLIMLFCSVFLYRLYQWLRLKNYRWQPHSLMATVLIIWALQMSGYAQWVVDNITGPARGKYVQFFSENEPTWPEWLREKDVQPDTFQALLALPFVHVGSEKLWLQDNDLGRTLMYGYQFALQTGTPLIDVMLSRTSWSQAFATVQLVDGLYSEKPLLDSFSAQPVAVLVNKHFPLKTNEQEWIKNARFIGSRHDMDIYSLSVNDFRAHSQKIRDSIKAIALNSPDKAGLTGDNPGFYFVNHFDQSVQQATFAGTGAFRPDKKVKEQFIAEIVPKLKDTSNHNYLFSIWVHCDSTDYKSPYFIFRQFNQRNELISELTWDTKYSTHVLDNWYLAERELSLKADVHLLKIFVGNPRYCFALDELAFWPAKNVYYYKPNDSTLLLNNRPQ
jgi:hypothetical protein